MRGRDLRKSKFYADAHGGMEQHICATIIPVSGSYLSLSSSSAAVAAAETAAAATAAVAVVTTAAVAAAKPGFRRRLI